MGTDSMPRDYSSLQHFLNSLFALCLRQYLPKYTSSQTTQPRHIKPGSFMVRELPHGPKAVYSIRHLSICGAYDNT